YEHCNLGLPGGCHSPVIQVADTGSFMTVSSQCPDSLDNVTRNTIEFKKTIPRKFLHPKKGKSC
ncbi:MAG: hypothetical protein ACR5K5_05680, partial [Wolbachia sp.]